MHTWVYFTEFVFFPKTLDLSSKSLASHWVWLLMNSVWQHAEEEGASREDLGTNRLGWVGDSLWDTLLNPTVTLLQTWSTLDSIPHFWPCVYLAVSEFQQTCSPFTPWIFQLRNEQVGVWTLSLWIKPSINISPQGHSFGRNGSIFTTENIQALPTNTQLAKQDPNSGKILNSVWGLSFQKYSSFPGYISCSALKTHYRYSSCPDLPWQNYLFLPLSCYNPLPWTHLNNDTCLYV